MNRKLKVAYVSHFSHLRMGGQKSTVHLIENLDRSKIAPIGICPEQGELSEKMESIACPCFFVPLYPIKPRHYVELITTYKMLRKLIAKEEIDILHPDRDADALICGLAKIGTGAKMVWHARVNAPHSSDRLNFSLANGVIGVSAAASGRFSAFPNFEHKCRTIFNGVDTEVFKPVENKADVRLKLGLPTDKFILIFVGQITKGKGIYELAESMRIMKNKNPDNLPLDNLPLLLYVGTPRSDGEKNRLVSFINDNELAGDVRIIPQQSNIHEWMQAADAQIIPSHEGVEGMPRVLYEAMACGTVGIGSDTSGVRETVTEDSGILVKENSPDDIAKTIIMLMSDKELVRKLQAGGRLRAVENFGIGRHARQVEEFYEEIFFNISLSK